MTDVAELVIQLRANADQVNASLTAIQGQLAGLSTTASKTENDVEKGLKTMHSAAETAREGFKHLTESILEAMGIRFAVNGLVEFTKQSLEAADKMVTMSKQTGISVEALQGLNYVATVSGTSVEALSTSVAFMNRIIGEAASGNKTAQASVTQLGLSWRQLAQLSPEEQFKTLVDRINGLSSQSEKAKASTDIFGRSWRDLAEVMSLGSKGISQAMDQAKQLGLIIGGEDLEKIKAFNDTMAVTKLRAEVLAQEGFIKLLDAMKSPTFQEFEHNMSDVAQSLKDAQPALETMGKGVVWLTGLLGPVSKALGQVAATTEFAFGVATVSTERFLGKIDTGTANDALKLLADHFHESGDAAKNATTGVDHLAGGDSGGLSHLKDVSTEAAKALTELQYGLDQMKDAAQIDVAKSMETDKISASVYDVDKAVSTLAAQYEKATGKVYQFSDAQKQTVADTRNLIMEKTAWDEIHGAIDDTRTPLEKYQQQVDDLGQALVILKNTNADFYNSDEGQKGVDAVKRKLADLRDQVSGEAQVFKDFATDIGNSFTTMFENIFDGGVKKFSDLTSSFLDVFKKMLAKLAMLAITQPIIVPMVTALGGAMGLSQNTIADTVKQLGGNPLQSASSGVSLFSTLGAGLSKSFLSDSLQTTLNGYGANVGLGSLGSVLGKIGTTGNLLAGTAGGFAGSLAFGSGTGQTIGSTIGGAAGAYFGGPIGSALGSFLGSGVGSLFGGKPSDKTEAGELNLGSNLVTATSGGAPGTKKYSAENTAARDAVFAFAQGLSSDLSSIIGTTVDKQLTVKIGSRDGSSYTLWGDSTKTFSSAAEMMKSLTTDISALYGASGKGADAIANLNTAIGHIDFSNTQQALADIQFALNLDHLGDAAKSLDDVDNEMTGLNTTFHNAQLQAARLGLSVDKVNEGYAKQVGYLQNSLQQGTSGSLLDMILPGSSDLVAENDNYAKSLHDYAVAGLDTAQLSLEHQLKIKELLAANDNAQQQQISNATTLVQTYGNLSTGWSSFLDELRNGKYTTKNPVANLADLRAQVETLGVAAKGGDMDAQTQLQTLLPQFLDLSAQVNGYNAEFAKDQAEASDLATAAKSVADQQLSVQQSILDAANSASSALDQLVAMTGGGTGGNANDKLVAALGSGYGGLSNSQIDAIFQQEGVTVAPGNGRRTAFLNDPANSSINANLNTVFHALGVPGFAVGGSIGGGMPGVDSVPLLAMPGEFVMRAKAAAALGAPTLSYMNATGRLPGNDNGEMAALRADVQRLTAVVYAGFSDSTDHLAGIRSSSARTAQGADRAAYRGVA